jgi:hypothetical protein
MTFICSSLPQVVTVMPFNKILIVDMPVGLMAVCIIVGSLVIDSSALLVVLMKMVNEINTLC